MYNKANLPITSLCLNITDSCNFNCRYCFVKQKPNYMSLQIAEDAIKWMMTNGEIYKKIMNKDPQYNILFFGGEPTLQWKQIIVPLVLQYPELQYSITTNGFLLNEEKIDFLSKHNFSLLLSMDGNEITQNYNRKNNSFEQLNKIIPYLIKKIPSCGFRGTIIPETCEYTFENICYAYQKGFSQIYFTIDIFSQWDDNSKQKLEKEIKKFTLSYINSFVNNKPVINFTPFIDMIKLIIKHELGILNPSIITNKCGLGNGYGAVDYQGNIFTCQEIVTDDQNNNIFNIGNIYSGINFDQLSRLKELVINDKPMRGLNCNDCSLAFCCKQQSCQVSNYICYQNCLTQSPSICWWKQSLYNYAALSISYLQNLPNFQQYMKNIVKKEVSK